MRLNRRLATIAGKPYTRVRRGERVVRWLLTDMETRLTHAVSGKSPRDAALALWAVSRWTLRSHDVERSGRLLHIRDAHTGRGLGAYVLETPLVERWSERRALRQYHWRNKRKGYAHARRP